MLNLSFLLRLAGAVCPSPCSVLLASCDNSRLEFESRLLGQRVMSTKTKTPAAPGAQSDALKTDLATFFKLGTVAPKEYAKVLDPEDNDGYVLPKGVTEAGMELEATEGDSNEDKLKAAHARLRELRKKKRQRDTTLEDAEEKHTRTTKVKRSKKTEPESEEEEDELVDPESDSEEGMDVDSDEESASSGDESEEEAKEEVELTEEEKKVLKKRQARKAARQRKSEARAAERAERAKEQAESGEKLRKRSKMSDEQKAEADSRTVFVGNVPINADKKALVKMFSQYGNVESVRFRNITVNNPDSRLKSIIKQDFHPERDSMVAYVVFDSDACVKPALKANGVEFGGKHLKVDSAAKAAPSARDYTNCVYVSGLPLGAEEEDLREMFQRCGNITSIRIVRDNHYKAAKGFGYVKFASIEGFNNALNLNRKITYKEKLLTVAKAISAETIQQQKNAKNSQHHRRPSSLADKYKSKSKKMSAMKKRK